MNRALTIASLLICLSAAVAADGPLGWPQFRGPNGSGVADAENPPLELGPDKNVKWKVAVPSGLSSPIIVGDLVVLTALDDGQLYTLAYHRQDGKEAWRAAAKAQHLEKFHKLEGSPAASTAVTDGRRIVAYFGSCGLIAYDLMGQELWRYEMPTASTAGDFGTGVSPIIADGRVVLLRDLVTDSKILAVDLATGKLAWERARQSPASYSTPVVWSTPAGKQIAAAGHARLIGYDLASGTEVWNFAGIPAGCCASPVIADGLLFFAGSSPGGADDPSAQKMPTYDGMLKDLDKDKDGALSKEEAEQAFGGFFDNQDANKDGKVSREEWDMIMKFMADGRSAGFALAPGATGEVTAAQLLWSQTKGLPYIASGIVYRDQYVMVKDGGIVTAYDAKSGKEIYQKRCAATGSYYASPVAAGGHIYFTSLTDGTITVLKAGAGTATVVAQNAPLGERVAATPAITGNTLYVRTAEHLYAFATRP